MSWVAPNLMSWLFQSKDSLQERAETTRHKNPMETTRTTACLSLPTSSMSENLPKLEFSTELKTPRICTGFPSQGTSTVLVSPRFRCRSRDETAATTYSFQGQPGFSYVQKKTKAHDFHGLSTTLLCWWKPVSPICLMCPKLLSTQLATSRNTLWAFLFPLFLFSKSCRSELAKEQTPF